MVSASHSSTTRTSRGARPPGDRGPSVVVGDAPTVAVELGPHHLAGGSGINAPVVGDSIHNGQAASAHGGRLGRELWQRRVRVLDFEP